MDKAVLQNLVNAIPNPAFVLGRNLIISCANLASERLFERPLAGQGFVHVLRQPEALACLNAAIETGEMHLCELVLKLPKSRTYQGSASSIGKAPSSPILFTLIDISAELDAEKSRSTFVANVSHELRSPLTSLMGVVETLRGPARNDVKARDRFLDLMQGETERMSRLVGDLLSLSKLEAKEHLTPDGDVDIAKTVRRVIAVLSESTPVYKGRVNLNASEGSVSVIGDRDELTEVFQNLIENALKYSAPDTKVDVTIKQAGDNPDRITVTVKDHGDGIAPEHIPRLTERFYRVDKGRSREMGGTGLGLAITKHILNRHRARMRIDSELGQGTVVSVELRRFERV